MWRKLFIGLALLILAIIVGGVWLFHRIDSRLTRDNTEELAPSPLTLPGNAAASRDVYADVLDLVFPTHWKQCDSLSRQVTIRILPSFFQESQILFCRLDGGQTFVIQSTLQPNDKSVWNHVTKVEKQEDGSWVQSMSTELPEVISARSRVIHKTCSVDSQTVNGWFRELATARMDVPELSIGADGTTYEITLEHGMDRIQARIWQGDEKKPLIVLANRIKAEIEKAGCTQVSRDSREAKVGQIRANKHSTRN